MEIFSKVAEQHRVKNEIEKMVVISHLLTIHPFFIYFIYFIFIPL
jgi:hypothetical protein